MILADVGQQFGKQCGLASDVRRDARQFAWRIPDGWIDFIGIRDRLIKMIWGDVISAPLKDVSMLNAVQNAGWKCCHRVRDGATY